MKYLLLLVVLLNTSFTSPGDISKLLCNKKWRMCYVIMEENIVNVPENIKMEDRPWIYFHENGKFENELRDELTKGRWTYDEKKKEIITIENKNKPVKAVLHLIMLTQDSLELRMDEKTSLGLICRENTSGE